MCVYIDTRTHTVSIVCEAEAKEMGYLLKLSDVKQNHKYS